jgi:hypothetical protein
MKNLVSTQLYSAQKLLAKYAEKIPTKNLAFVKLYMIKEVKHEMQHA